MTLFSSAGLRVCAHRILSACQVLGQHRVPEFFDQAGMCRFVDEIIQLAGIIGQIEQFTGRVGFEVDRQPITFAAQGRERPNPRKQMHAAGWDWAGYAC